MNDAALMSSAMTVVKILVIIGLVIYSFFAVIVVRQEQLMSHVLEESSETVLRILVKIHLLLSVALILLAFIIL